MKIKNFQIFLALIVIVLSSLACEFNVSSAKISDAYMSSTNDGSNKTTTFSGDQSFFCIVTLSNAPDNTTIKAVWTAVDVDGVDPNLFLDEVELTTEGKNEFVFDLQNDSLWPTGVYKVDIFLNGTLDRTLEFSVQ